MKRSLLLCLLALTFTYTTNTGCIKSPGGGGVTLPDLSSFSVAASSFAVGAASTIEIASSSLGSGTFTVNYSLSGANNLVNQAATIIMNAGAGTFQTPALTGVSTTEGTTITINSIQNSAGGSANPSGNNVQTFSDSTGLMTATITGASGGPTSFRGIQVSALLAGENLQIDGVIFTPVLTAIDLNVHNYMHANSTTAINISDPGTNAGAFYNVSGNGIAIADIAQTGTISITGTSPLLTGTFSYTNQDGSVVSGSFSCPAP